MSLKSLIIGCGRIAGGYSDAGDGEPLTHAAAFQAAGVEMAGCVDVDSEKSGEFARRWKIASWGVDAGALLRETNPSIVSICTPASARLPLLEAALGHPSVAAVIVEKPLATTGAEARAMAALSEDKPVLVNYQRAFDPFYARLERTVAAGDLGPLRSIAARYYGTAQTIASHWLERVLGMLGTDCTARKLGGTPDSPLFEVRCAGVPALFMPSDGCTYSPFELDMLFERGRIRVVDSERRAEQFRAVPDPRYAGYFTLDSVPALDGVPPSAGSLLPVVRAAAAAAHGQPVRWRPLLARAVRVTEILDSLT